MRWINVLHKMPKLNQQILAYGQAYSFFDGLNSEYIIAMSIYESDKERYKTNKPQWTFGDGKLKNVTHWMPLPEKPKESSIKILENHSNEYDLSEDEIQEKFKTNKYPISFSLFKINQENKNIKDWLESLDEATLKEDFSIINENEYNDDLALTAMIYLKLQNNTSFDEKEILDMECEFLEMFLSEKLRRENIVHIIPDGRWKIKLEFIIAKETEL